MTAPRPVAQPTSQPTQRSTLREAPLPVRRPPVSVAGLTVADQAQATAQAGDRAAVRAASEAAVAAAAAAVSAAARRDALRALLGAKGPIRTAVLLSEVLGPPVALRREGSAVAEASILRA